ncbi:hypothetical protein KFK09_016992 [Dendrobium nobile]|uniref:Uncharacterized protein n=1 Tax=Dendrobium nobile TaxID=94219 RepID=A0A8T3B0Z2_DENNO|nr:hypothetical protein KFK09_016992 [Dendrobium nobile]
MFFAAREFAVYLGHCDGSCPFALRQPVFLQDAGDPATAGGFSSFLPDLDMMYFGVDLIFLSPTFFNTSFLFLGV